MCSGNHTRGITFCGPLLLNILAVDVSTSQYLLSLRESYVDVLSVDVAAISGMYLSTHTHTHTTLQTPTMVSFNAPAYVLLAVLLPTRTHGFTSHALTSSKRYSTPLHSTVDETFQRSLLEAQLANSGASPAADHIVTSVNGSVEQPTELDKSLTDIIATQNSILRIAASTDRGQ